MMTTDATGSSATGSSEMKYKGVRKRKWGKWVSEVRLPHCRERIWLGSYDSAEKAARAFDAATFCLRGRHAQLNFPDNPPQVPVDGASLTHQQIQDIATRHAHSGASEPTAVGAEDSPVETPMPDVNAEVNPPETQTATAVGAEDSPVETPMPDANVEVNLPPPQPPPPLMDWSSFDLMNEGFSMIDEFPYNFTSPVMTGPVDGEEEEECGARPRLWNF